MCYIRLQSTDPERTLNNNTLKQFVHLQKKLKRQLKCKIMIAKAIDLLHFILSID